MDLFGKLKNNDETKEEKNNRIAKETIETYLSQFKNIDEYYANLNKTGRDIFSDMISHEDEEKILNVLEVIIDVNRVDNEGFSYLSYACLEHKVKVIEMLLKKGANPNHENKRGTVALFHALGRKNKHNPEILDLFLKYGVNLRTKVNGSTIEDTIRMFGDEELNEILNRIK